MKIKNMLSNIVIVALCLVFVVFVFYTVSEFIGYYDSYHPDESDFLYSVQQQEYASMVQMMYRNEAADIKTNNTYEECYAVARYYEAATYYKAYQHVGNNKAAAEKLEIMKEQALQMGELSFAAEDINKKLEIEADIQVGN